MYALAEKLLLRSSYSGESKFSFTKHNLLSVSQAGPKTSFSCQGKSCYRRPNRSPEHERADLAGVLADVVVVRGGIALLASCSPPPHSSQKLWHSYSSLTENSL